MSRPLRVASAVAAATSASEPYPRYACGKGQDHYPFCNTKLSLEQRVEDVLKRLTIDEKPQLMEARYSPLGNISRLGIPQYDWGANCIHGVQSRCGTGSKGDVRCPTAYPNPNHLGASFNDTLWHGMGRVIGVELRSLWRQEVGEYHDSNLPPLGLDCWSPNINLVRDPRWGRNLETPGEDPLLLGRFGIAVTKGLQEGDDPKYLQAIVTLKHFVANTLEGTWDGPGGPAKYPGTGLCPGGKCTRDTIDPNISAYDLASTYFVAFRESVEKGGALGVMCSYNSVNGVPSCANKWLLGDKLRKEWGFQGYVTGDSGAVSDIAKTHFYAPTMQDAVIAAVEAGTDIQSAGWPPGHPWAVHGEYIDLIPKAVREGELKESAVDEALRHTLRLRFRLGLFDPPEDQLYEHISPDAVRSDEHVAAAVDATEQGLVLLQNRPVGANQEPALPISGGVTAVIGPHAQARGVLIGNYVGQSCPKFDDTSCIQNFYEALQAEKLDLSYAPGLSSVTSTDKSLFPAAVAAAKASDRVLLFLGLDVDSVEREGQDRHETTLPAGQLDLLAELQKVGKPIIVVLLNGGVVSSAALKEQADAVVEAWYPGFYGAQAVARALVGKTNRWGKLPVTVYDEDFTKNVDMLDFDMAKAPGRTYRYYTGEPLWPFGYGMSYTTFQLKLSASPGVVSIGGSSKLTVEVHNIGKLAGDDVVMAYFKPSAGTLPRSARANLIRRQLFNYKRISIAAGASADVAFEFSAADLALFADNGDKVSYPGMYEIELSNGLTSISATVKVDGSGPVVLQPWEPRAEPDILQI